MDHMFSIGFISGETGVHSINLVSMKSFWARWAVLSFAEYERALRYIYTYVCVVVYAHTLIYSLAC